MAIGALFTIVIVFALTKPSKVIISNKPPQVNEQEIVPKTDPLRGEEAEPVHQAVDAQDGVSTGSAQTDDKENQSRHPSTAETQQERLDRPELTQRLMAQAPGRAPVSPVETISAVDLQQLMRLGAQGNASAQNQLGQLYVNGRGVHQNYTTARGWYEKAAVQGNTWTQAQLGQLYANGRGVPQDYSTARIWYEKAAAQGNAWAQAQLALL